MSEGLIKNNKLFPKVLMVEIFMDHTMTSEMFNFHKIGVIWCMQQIILIVEQKIWIILILTIYIY